MPVNFVFGSRNKLLGKGNISTPKLIGYVCSSSNKELDNECLFLHTNDLTWVFCSEVR